MFTQNHPVKNNFYADKSQKQKKKVPNLCMKVIGSLQW